MTDDEEKKLEEGLVRDLVVGGNFVAPGVCAICGSAQCEGTHMGSASALPRRVGASALMAMLGLVAAIAPALPTVILHGDDDRCRAASASECTKGLACAFHGKMLAKRARRAAKMSR